MNALQASIHFRKSRAGLILQELVPDLADVRERLGHRTLGFEPEALKRMARAAGFRRLRLDLPAHDAGSPFRVFIMTGETA